VNPDPLDESPLAEEPLAHPAGPGPHTTDGVLVAEIGALLDLLGPSPPARIEGDRAFVGDPEVLILGHLHHGALYVPVKLFARQFGAYVDVTGTPANHGIIWPAPILEHMRSRGFTQGAGILEGYAEGLIDSVDVRARPGY
jgi:hypothetical protein